MSLSSRMELYTFDAPSTSVPLPVVIVCKWSLYAAASEVALLCDRALADYFFLHFLQMMDTESNNMRAQLIAMTRIIHFGAFPFGLGSSPAAIEYETS